MATIRNLRNGSVMVSGWQDGFAWRPMLAVDQQGRERWAWLCRVQFREVIHNLDWGNPTFDYRVPPYRRRWLDWWRP